MALALESKFSEAEARELTDELRSDYGSLQVKISTAWQGRIWLALGYDSWQDYLDNEFRDVSLRPPKDLEEQVISELRAAGMSTRGIASAVDISHPTVYRRLRDAGVSNETPEDAARTGEPSDSPAVPAPWSRRSPNSWSRHSRPVWPTVTSSSWSRSRTSVRTSRTRSPC